MSQLLRGQKRADSQSRREMLKALGLGSVALAASTLLVKGGLPTTAEAARIDRVARLELGDGTKWISGTYPAIRMATLSIAPSDAPEQVQAQCDFIAPGGDDTTVAQTALQLLAALGGGHLSIAQGTLTCNRLEWDGGGPLKITGAGMGATTLTLRPQVFSGNTSAWGGVLNIRSQQAMTYAELNSGAITLTQVDDVLVEDITFDGNRGNHSGTLSAAYGVNCVFGVDVANVIFHRCEFTNGVCEGGICWDPEQVKYIDCVAHGCGRMGINLSVTVSASKTAKRCLVAGNFVYNNALGVLEYGIASNEGHAGMSLSDTEDLVCVNNVGYQNKWANFFFQTFSRAYIAGNRSIESLQYDYLLAPRHGYGYRFGTGWESAIVGNHSYQDANLGILVSPRPAEVTSYPAPRNCQYIGNAVRESNTGGFYVGTGGFDDGATTFTGYVFDGNTAYKNQQDGFRFARLTDGAVHNSVAVANSQTTNNTYHNLNFYDLNNAVEVSGNITRQGDESNKPNCGISVANDADNQHIHIHANNVITGGVTAPISVGASAVDIYVHDNYGYISSVDAGAFLQDVYRIIGSAAFIYEPRPGETTTSTDRGQTGATITYPQSQYSFDMPPRTQGKGWQVNFGGQTDERATTPYAARFTKSLQPFTIVVVGSFTDVLNNTLLAIWDSTTGAEKQQLFIDTQGVGQFQFLIYDQTTAAQIGRRYSTPPSANIPFVAMFTYDGGSTSAGMKIYLSQGGTKGRVDNTDNNSGAFAQMQDTGAPLTIGYYTDIVGNPNWLFKGGLNLVAYSGAGVELGLDDFWQLCAIVAKRYGIAV